MATDNHPAKNSPPWLVDSEGTVRRQVLESFPESTDGYKSDGDGTWRNSAQSVHIHHTTREDPLTGIINEHLRKKVEGEWMRPYPSQNYSPDVAQGYREEGGAAYVQHAELLRPYPPSPPEAQQLSAAPQAPPPTYAPQLPGPYMPPQYAGPGSGGGYASPYQEPIYSPPPQVSYASSPSYTAPSADSYVPSGCTGNPACCPLCGGR